MIKKPLTTLLQRCLLAGWGLCALQVHAADWYIDNKQELIKDDTVGQTFDNVFVGTGGPGFGALSLEDSHLYVTGNTVLGVDDSGAADTFGMLNVIGENSLFSSSTLTLRNNAYVLVDQGAKVTLDSADISGTGDLGPDSQILVQGNNSSLTVGTMQIASGTKGMFTVMDGGRANAQTIIMGGTASDNEGYLVVMGSGTRLDVATDLVTVAGQQGILVNDSATLTASTTVLNSKPDTLVIMQVSNESQVSSDDLVLLSGEGESYLIVGSGSQLTTKELHVLSTYASDQTVSMAMVVDPGSKLTVTDNLVLGSFSDGVNILRVASGAELNAPDIVLDASVSITYSDVSGSSSLVIGNTEGLPATLPGIIKANSIELKQSWGTSVLLNHSSDNYMFDQHLTNGLKGNGKVQAIAGRSIFVNDHPDFKGELLMRDQGILQVNGNMTQASAMILPGGMLEGVGVVGSTTNQGMVSPAGAGVMGTLTVAGNYVGQSGVLALDVMLDGDGSPSDLLVVQGDTSGTTDVVVNNAGGSGALTVNGIRVVHVDGASNGTFRLQGDYIHDGQPAVVAGAYAYKLYKGSANDPGDGDWYLRSSQTSPEPSPDDPSPEPPSPDRPLFQPGAPVYEAYPGLLQAMNTVSTLRERLGSRYWAGKPQWQTGLKQQTGAWVRVEGLHGRMKPGTSSTTGVTYDQDVLKVQIGIDHELNVSESGAWVGGLTAQYTNGKGSPKSSAGDGQVNSNGYGVGATLTWYGRSGSYVDSQAQVTWYRSDLSSTAANRTLVSGNEATGYALSVEAGQQVELGGGWSMVPQAQLTYSSVDFSAFTDVFGAKITLNQGDSLRARMGMLVNFDLSSSARGARGNVYGLANLYYEFLNGTSVNLSGVKLSAGVDRTWAGLGVGGAYSWSDGRYALYGELSYSSPVDRFGQSYALKAEVGFRMRW